jgi:hypothetical protein
MAWLAWAVLALQDTKPELDDARLFVYDAAKGASLKVLKDGRVELRASKETLDAPSVDEFRARHPAAVLKYDLGRWLGETPRLGRSEDEWTRWIEKQREEMEELRKLFRAPGAPASEREFGLRVEGVEETLRQQLGLKDGEGLQVAEVKPGSAADRAGLKKHDLVLAFDGRPAGDRWAFRRDVLAGLDGGFELLILRGGKRETVRVKP